MFKARQNFNKINNIYIALILLIIILIIHINMLLAPIGTYFSNFDKEDLHYYITIRQYAFDTIKSGIFPLWTTKIFCGTPFLANSETAIFYLPNIIFFILQGSKAINFSFLLHFFILSFSVFLWINNKIKDKLISSIVAIISIFISNFYLHFYAAHLSNIITICWFPLLLYFYDKTSKEKTFLNIFPITFIISLQIFAGHLQYVYYTAFVSFLYILIFCRNKYTVTTIITSYFVSLLLTAIQLLPSYTFYLDGGRISNIFNTGNISIHSKIQYLITLLFNINIPFTSSIFWETSNYIGTLNFFIILLTLFHIWNKNILKNILIVLFLYLLTFESLSNIAEDILPCFSWFRSPIKILFLANILILPLLAYGIKFITSKIKINIIFPFFIFIFALFTFIYKETIISSIISNNILSKDEQNIININLTISASLFLLFSILLYFKKYYISKILIIILLVIEPIIVMKLYAKPFIYKNDYKYEYISKESFNKQPRFYSATRYNLKYDAENILGLFPDKLKNYLLFIKKEANDNISAVLRYKYFINDDSGSVIKTENKTLNRINIFYNYTIEKDKKSIFNLLSNENFNIFDSVILEQEPEIKPENKGKYNVEILKFDENSIEFQCDTDEPAIILYTDNYTKDWKAYNIDNPEKKYKLICADYIYKAISVDKGTHKIRFEYKPLSFVIGLWISIISWIIFILSYFLLIYNKNKIIKK